MAGHTYICVVWKHDHPDEPTELWSELDERRFEVRKVELWRDGRVGFADQRRSAENTRLGIEAVPSVHEINAQAEFDAKETDRNSFERLWRTAAS